MGGKARGIAFLSFLHQQQSFLKERYPLFDIRVPRTLVICTDVFEAFVHDNRLKRLARTAHTDEQVGRVFDAADFPEWVTKKLEIYLSQVTCPLIVRSSSQRAGAYFQSHRGLYGNCFLPNNHDDLATRLIHLLRAIKGVYASTYFETPRMYRNNTSTGPDNDAMAVIIQELAGRPYGNYFYPAVSGVATSHNFYPVSHMRPEEGVVHVRLGLGNSLTDPGQSLRFSPKHPHILPQFFSVAETLRQSQKRFYALQTHPVDIESRFRDQRPLSIRFVDDAPNDPPVTTFAATYILAENRIRDTAHMSGPKVMTFARLLKYGDHGFPDLLCDLLAMGKQGMGGCMEIDFALNLPTRDGGKWELNLLQIRPLAVNEPARDLRITRTDRQRAICTASRSLGNGCDQTVLDIVCVNPARFKKDNTPEIAEEIGRLNRQLTRESRPYLLVGPGRWGSSDRRLGIPVKWPCISGARVIVEIRDNQLNVDPSNGSHFFNQVISNGVFYFAVNLSETRAVAPRGDTLDWERIHDLGPISETAFLTHVRLTKPLLVKVDGRTGQGIIACT